jgi:hypothetical protein
LNIARISPEKCVFLSWIQKYRIQFFGEVEDPENENQNQNNNGGSTPVPSGDVPGEGD